MQKTEHISIKIYNLAGQKITTLFDGVCSAGERQLQWQPVELASGIYYYRLQVGDFSETKKLLIQK